MATLNFLFLVKRFFTCRGISFKIGIPKTFNLILHRATLSYVSLNSYIIGRLDRTLISTLILVPKTCCFSVLLRLRFLFWKFGFALDCSLKKIVCNSLSIRLWVWSHTLGARSIVGSHFPVRGVKRCKVYEIIHTIDLAPNVWLHSSVGRASHR